MAYRPSDLSALAYANGFTLWHYRTSDSAADVDSVGYFNQASRMIRVGDFILLNAGIGTVPVHGVMVVLSNTYMAVDVANLTSFGAVNTD
jgi:hypothetical protein